MLTPAWILNLFAALMLIVAAASAARLAAARPWRPGAVSTDTDISHLLMGIAMAGMLTASLTTLPNSAWEVIFGLLTAWFGYRVSRDARANGARALTGGHCAPHLVHSAAMLYMFLALAAPAASSGAATGMNGMGGPAMPTLRYPTLALVFALILIGYSIWDLDQLSGRRYSLPAAGVPAAGAVLAGIPAMAGRQSATAAFSGAQATGNAAATEARPGAAAADRAASGGSAAGGGSAARAWLLSPGTTVGCRIAMGVTMALMLFVMI